ncbi:MAG: RNA polymerase sporulation sigma factor SigG [Clostridiales bacterium]|nr:RNA polymerase sporulation sigma factor SigG [Clostridiales bacterium]
MYSWSNKVEICGVNTAKLKTLTAEEKHDLLVKAHDGDTAARDELIAGNLRLVLSIIQRFTSRGENLDDLFQVGCVGLIKAVDNFDLSLDVKFSTYAVPMIIGEIRRYLRDNNLVRVSRSVRDLAYRALTAREELSRTLDREPTTDDIAKKLGEKPEDVAAALDAIVEPVSLYEPVYSEGGDSIYIMDQISDNDNTDEQWLEDISLKEAMKRLSPREKNIIDLRFFKGRTQMEIAGEIGISQAQVSRIEKGALERIKKSLR